MHGAIRAVHVLVDHPRDEVGCEGDDEGLGIEDYQCEQTEICQTSLSLYE